LSIALSVQEAEKQEKINESFYTRFENSVRLLSRSLERTYREDSSSRHSADTHAVNLTRGQHYKAPHCTEKPMTSGTRSSQTKAALKCNECEGMGDFTTECPTRLEREAKPSDSPGRKNPSELLRCSRSPNEKRPYATKREVRKGTKSQGNE